MNYLAHVALSQNDPELILGNMLGDFVPLSRINSYPPRVSLGIKLHKAIDRFTDSHPVFLRSKSHIRDDYRILKGVMVDIFYDHFLAVKWENYYQESLPAACQNFYAVFCSNLSLVPEKLQKMLPRLVSENWFVSYGTLEGINWVLNGLSGRLSRPNLLGRGIGELKEHYQKFSEDFDKFYPELQSFVVHWLRQNATSGMNQNIPPKPAGLL